MTEYVVTLRDGRRVDVEADTHELTADTSGTLGHVFTAPAPDDPSMPGYRQTVSVRYPESQVVLIQRRNAHLLAQVWPT